MITSNNILKNLKTKIRISGHFFLNVSICCCNKSLRLQTFSDVLEARLAREATVLNEKDAGVNNILVQLGRDTAIIEAHKLMLKQQQDKVAQIQQVGILTLSKICENFGSMLKKFYCHRLFVLSVEYED
jgi:hypothetical protein